MCGVGIVAVGVGVVRFAELVEGSEGFGLEDAERENGALGRERRVLFDVTRGGGGRDLESLVVVPLGEVLAHARRAAKRPALLVLVLRYWRR